MDIEEVLNEATKRPWEVHQSPHLAGALWLSIGHNGVGPITEMHGSAIKFWSPVSQMKFLITDDSQQQANAELICLAVNAFEAYRELIRQLTEVAGEVPCIDCDHPLKCHLQNGCEYKRGDGYPNGSEILQALGPCGCKRAWPEDIKGIVALIAAYVSKAREIDEFENENGCY